MSDCFAVSPLQIRIIKKLKGFKRYNVQKMCRELGVTYSSTSKNIIKLEEMGLVSKTPEGRSFILELKDKYKNIKIVDNA